MSQSDICPLCGADLGPEVLTVNRGKQRMCYNVHCDYKREA